MGRRGPPRKPTVLKRLAGNPGKHRLPENEPKVEPAIPTCPGHLDELARREWKRISGELEPIGLLTRLDRAALAMYCAAWSDWVRYSEKVRETAAVVKSPSGYPILNPYVSLSDRAFERMQRTLRGLGLTPGDRASLNVQVPDGKPPSEFELFLAGKLPDRPADDADYDGEDEDAAEDGDEGEDVAEDDDAGGAGEA